MTTPSPELAAILLRMGNLAGQAARPTSMSIELTRAVGSVRQLFDAAACSVALVEPDGGSLRFVAAAGAGAEAIVGVTLPLGRGIVGWVVMAGQGIAIDDANRDSRFARDVAQATEYVPQVILAVPLVDPQEGVVGVIEVLDPRLGATDTGHALNVLGTVGDQIASIVRLAKVYDGMGEAMLRAASQSEDEASFGAALRELAGAADDGGLTALASTLNELISLGPHAASLAQRVLEEVVSFARTRR